MTDRSSPNLNPKAGSSSKQQHPRDVLYILKETVWISLLCLDLYEPCQHTNRLGVCYTNSRYTQKWLSARFKGLTFQAASREMRLAKSSLLTRTRGRRKPNNAEEKRAEDVRKGGGEPLSVEPGIKPSTATLWANRNKLADKLWQNEAYLRLLN